MNSKWGPIGYALGVLLGGLLLLGMSGCGTFSGMTVQDQDRANKDVANESKFMRGGVWKPDRTLQNPLEPPAQFGHDYTTR